jgi:hypothetical protein
MNKFVSIRGDCAGEINLSVLVDLAFVRLDEEHVALLVESRRFPMFRRKDDLLAEGVAAIFGVTNRTAELLGFCFNGERFTHAEAANWLAERRFAPLHFIPITGSALT